MSALFRKSKESGGNTVTNYYEQLRRGSENHSVQIGTDGITIAPVDCADSRDALDRFQLVAKTAIEHDGEGYEICIRVYRGSLATLLTLKPLT